MRAAATAAALAWVIAAPASPAPLRALPTAAESDGGGVDDLDDLARRLTDDG